MQSLEGVFREAVVPEDPEKRRKIQVTIPELTEPLRKRVEAMAAANRVGFPLTAIFIRANGKSESMKYKKSGRKDFLRRLWHHFLTNPLGEVRIVES